jgi:hypothetical protein
MSLVTGEANEKTVLEMLAWIAEEWEQIQETLEGLLMVLPDFYIVTLHLGRSDCAFDRFGNF